MYSIFLLSFILLPAALAFGGDYLNPGDPAPDFMLKDGEGKTHTLSDYRGKTVILYFYPKDDTPGCTAEACNLRDNYQTMLEKDLVILGVSFDDTTSHKAFARKYHLPFPLLADTDKKVADQYGAKGAFTGLFVAKRITYIIDPEGKIAHRIDNVDTKNHTRQILELLENE